MPGINIPKRLVGCDLVALAARNPAALVQQCEQGYQARIDAAAARVLRSGCRIVMVTGPSAAGKTTSANKLAQAIRAQGKRCEVISLDDFFVGEGRYPKRADGGDDYECVEALDLPQLQGCLRQLAATGRCDAPTFDFLTQRPTGTTHLVDCSGGVAVVEGLHAFNPVLTDALPADAVLNIYTSLREEYAAADGSRSIATRDVRLARRLTRDWLFRGHDAEFTLALWDHVCEAEDRYIKVFKRRADLVLDTAFSYEICLWGAQLAKIDAGSLAPGHAGRLAGLRRSFAPLPPLPPGLVPAGSMLREFIGAENEKNC